MPENVPVDLEQRERRTSRGRLLGRAAVAGGAVLGGGALAAALPRDASPAPSVAQDVRILNFALVLEYLQEAFYAEAVRKRALRGELREFADVVQGHERDHVAFLRDTLGTYARKRPSFDFGRATADEKRFVAAASQLEDLAVGAYNGQAAALTEGALASITKIVSVEARHVAWIRDIVGELPAPRAADPGLTAAQTSAAIARTGYLRGIGGKR
jgi:rubrerythrin